MSPVLIAHRRRRSSSSRSSITIVLKGACARSPRADQALIITGFGI